MSNEGTANWAYASMLAGGLLILVGGLAGASMMMLTNDIMATGWMMDGYAPAMDSGWITSMAWWLATVGVLTGGVVLYAAYRFRRGGSDPTSAGTIAIVAGALSLFSMGGWIIGAVLAVVGGALAIGGSSRARAQPA